MSRKPTSVFSTRLVDDGGAAADDLATAIGETPSMVGRAILTAGLRTLYTVEDETADAVLAKIKAHRREART